MANKAKIKGNKLQNWVKNRLVEVFPDLMGHISTPYGREPGMDIKLSPTARESIPYAIECKNQERWNVPEYWKQTTRTATKEGLEPLLIMGKDKHEMLVVMRADHFFEILEADPIGDWIVTLDEELEGGILGEIEDD